MILIRHNLGANVAPLAPNWRYTPRVPSVQIKNVPPEVLGIWKHRAVEAGQSLQEYLLAKLVEDASVPTREEWLKRLESRPDTGSRVPLDEIVRIIREDRDSH